MWLAAVFLGLGCTSGSSTTWVQFDGDDDQLEVAIGPDVLSAVSVDIRSTTGAALVAAAAVDPGGGPVGTVHRVVVTVLGEFADEIGKVELLTDAGDRGAETIGLTQDSARSDLWVREVVSVGDDGEVRADTFSFALYVAAGDSDGG
jgi:hypothetical protein